MNMTETKRSAIAPAPGREYAVYVKFPPPFTKARPIGKGGELVTKSRDTRVWTVCTEDQAEKLADYIERMRVFYNRYRDPEHQAIVEARIYRKPKPTVKQRRRGYR